jgi:hypothetical protein
VGLLRARRAGTARELELAYQELSPTVPLRSRL